MTHDDAKAAADRMWPRYADRLRVWANDNPPANDPGWPDGVIVSCEVLHHALDVGDEMAALLLNLVEANGKLQHLLDATRKAKAEDDGRFMLERDEAREECARLRKTQALLEEQLRIERKLAKQSEDYGLAQFGELQRLRAEAGQLRAALEPFVEAARGIPPNWPAECRLNWDTNNGCSWHLTYLAADDSASAPTIAAWRAAAEVLAATAPKGSST